MTVSQKVRRIRDLHATANALAGARIRAWYGDVSSREMNLRLAAMRFDRATMIRLFD